MNERITECRMPAEEAAAECRESKLTEPVADPCTVSTVDPCTVGSKECGLMSGDAAPQKKEETAPAEEDDEDYCCFDH